MQQQTFDGIGWGIDDAGIARIVMDSPTKANHDERRPAVFESR